MKRKTILKAHIIATVIAIRAIISFFTLSLIAEINGDKTLIKSIKAIILYALPIIVIAMPILKITGDQLAGKSNNPFVRNKKKRMNFIVMNGIALITLAIFLYYRSHFQTIDNIFLVAQITEFGFGIANLILIALNVKSGMLLTGKLKKT